jgi:hypothetical protein
LSGKFPVRHVRGFCLKWNQARKGLQNGTLAWADEAHSEIRDTTLAESIAIQSELAAHRERICRPEVIACRFRHPGAAAGRPLTRTADVFSHLADRGLAEAAEIVARQLPALSSYYHPVSA